MQVRQTLLFFFLKQEAGLYLTFITQQMEIIQNQIPQ